MRHVLEWTKDGKSASTGTANELGATQQLHLQSLEFFNQYGSMNRYILDENPQDFFHTSTEQEAERIADALFSAKQGYTP